MMWLGASSWKGDCRVSSSHSSMPNDQQSAFSLMRSGVFTSSGAMNGSVPLHTAVLRPFLPVISRRDATQSRHSHQLQVSYSGSASG